MRNRRKLNNNNNNYHLQKYKRKHCLHSTSMNKMEAIKMQTAFREEKTIWEI